MILRISVLWLVVTVLLINYANATLETDECPCFEGIMTPVFTFYNNDTLKINTCIIPDYAKYLAERGVRGVIVCGPRGEGELLTLSEKKQVFRAWMTAAKLYGLVVILHIIAMPYPELIELIEYGLKYKVDAIMFSPLSLYYRPFTEDKGVADLKFVADYAKNLPIFYYYSAHTTGDRLNMFEFYKLATKEIPNFYGICSELETAIKINSGVEVMDYQYLMIISHIYVQATFALKFKTSVSTASNLLPELVVGIKNSENKHVAAACQERLNLIIATIAKPRSYLESLKAAFTIITGIGDSNCRFPLPSTTYEQRKNITIQLQKLDISLKNPVC